MINKTKEVAAALKGKIPWPCVTCKNIVYIKERPPPFDVFFLTRCENCQNDFDIFKEHKGPD